ANADRVATATTKKKGDDQIGPKLTKSNKEKRMENEKTLKFRGEMETYFNKALLQQMFHDDFKHHIQTLTTLQKACDDYLDETTSNLDLILRWLTLRFYETNPSLSDKNQLMVDERDVRVATKNFVNDDLKKIVNERQQQQPASLPLSDNNSTKIGGDGGGATLLSQYTRLHREKTQQLKQQFVWIDIISSSPHSNDQPSPSLQIPDFVPAYNGK
ncbi:unnamed protein product, partial [Didymodactylos carnosus]